MLILCLTCRAFARVYILLTPIAFGPYYALVAQSTNILFAILLSIITSSAMQGLYNLRFQLEDPFYDPLRTHSAARLSEDTIDLMAEFQVHLFRSLFSSSSELEINSVFYLRI